ncbi:hypothetical protein LINPERPRIM_LOCUS11859 [Linum perenne]
MTTDDEDSSSIFDSIPPSTSSPATSASTESMASNPDLLSGGLTIPKLNGRNYLQWSRSVQMFITGRSKGGFLTGKTPKPDDADTKFEQWNNDDNLVRFWLISTMDSKIGNNYLLHPTAKSIWDHAKKTYSTTDNSSALLELETEIFNLKQGEMNTNEYYNALSHAWLQLDHYETYDWDTTKDAETYKKAVEKKRTLHFLLGLNQELDDAKGRVMATKPFPALEEAVAEIRREEYRRHVMRSDSKSVLDGSALHTGVLASKPDPKQLSSAALFSKQNKPKPDDVVCEHCGKLWHTKKECWKLLGGKPKDWKSKSELRAIQARANSTAIVTQSNDCNQFSAGQKEAIQKMLVEALKGAQLSTSMSEGFTSMFAQNGGGIREDDWQD